jgi:hypothetical protein
MSTDTGIALADVYSNVFRSIRKSFVNLRIREKHFLPRLLPSAHGRHNRLRIQAPQFLRLHLVQPAAVHAAFADERLSVSISRNASNTARKSRGSLRKAACSGPFGNNNKYKFEASAADWFQINRNGFRPLLVRPM